MSPAAFQALGISRAIPTGETHCSDYFGGLSWPFAGTFPQNLVSLYFPRSVLKHNLQKSRSRTLLQPWAVITSLLLTAAFRGHLNTPHRRDKHLQRLSQAPKRDSTHAMDLLAHSLFTRIQVHNWIPCIPCKHRDGSLDYFSPGYS